MPFTSGRRLDHRRRRALLLGLLVTVSLLVPTALAASMEAAPAADHVLRLSVTARDAPDASPRLATLSCAPGRASATGFLSAVASSACRLAERLSGLLLAPPNPGRICAQIYGGPQTAEVRGVIDGARFRRSFARRNGCEISDWNRAALLLGSGPAAASQPARRVALVVGSRLPLPHEQLVASACTGALPQSVTS